MQRKNKKQTQNIVVVQGNKSLDLIFTSFFYIFSLTTMLLFLIKGLDQHVEITKNGEYTMGFYVSEPRVGTLFRVNYVGIIGIVLASISLFSYIVVTLNQKKFNIYNFLSLIFLLLLGATIFSSYPTNIGNGKFGWIFNGKDENMWILSVAGSMVLLFGSILTVTAAALGTVALTKETLVYLKSTNKNFESKVETKKSRKNKYECVEKGIYYFN